MRPFPLTVMRGGINRQRVKGAARADMLYDLLNARITNAGAIIPREGTSRTEVLDSTTVGLMAQDGIFNVFSTTLEDVPAGYQCNVLINPNNSADTLSKIWFAKPFMGFPFVVAQFTSGDIFTYWLQSNGSWAPDTVYMTGAIVTPDSPNGLAYQAVRDTQQNPTWSAGIEVTAGQMVEPTEYTGYAYRAVAVSSAPGTSAFTGESEPDWPTTIGGIVDDYGNFNLQTSTSATTQSTSTATAIPLGDNITNRYGDSSTIAGQAGTSTTVTEPIASTVVNTWVPGTLYAPGAVVKPGTNQGAFINAIPNGDFEAGDDGNWVLPDGTTTIIDNPSLSYQGDFCLQFALTDETRTVTMTDFGLVTAGQAVTASAYLNPNNAGANMTMWINLNWYTSGDVFISSTPLTVGASNSAEGPGYRKVSVTATAPATAAHCRVSITSSTGTHSINGSYADLVSWSLEEAAAVSNFLYEAVQTNVGTSGATQPAWPTTAGDTVVDNTVTWEAIGTSIITWQAVPIMLSGGQGIIATLGTLVGGTAYTNGTYPNVPLTGGSGQGAIATVVVSGNAVTSVTIQSGGHGYVVGDTLSCSNTSIGGTGSGFSIKVATITGNAGEPSFPTTIGTTVYDPSTYTTNDGFSNNTSMSWQAITRVISDVNCPNNPAAALGASHAFEGNDDICSYCAAVNPTDWTSANNAGYLPTGLNNYGDNPVAVLALYRANLIVMNAGGYQMWQIDPDPQNMALLDAQPVGSIYTRAAQSVANDLLFLAEVGVRNLSTVGATANMQIGNTGQPIDPLVLAKLQSGDLNAGNIISLYYPALGQYWVIFGDEAFVLSINGAGIRSWSRYVFPDSITDWTLNAGILYLRTASDLIWQVGAQFLQDDVHNSIISVTGGAASDAPSYLTPPSDVSCMGVGVNASDVAFGSTSPSFAQIGNNTNQLLGLFEFQSESDTYLVLAADGVMAQNAFTELSLTLSATTHTYTSAGAVFIANGTTSIAGLTLGGSGITCWAWLVTSGNVFTNFANGEVTSAQFDSLGNVGVDFAGVIQWPYLDLASLGVNKQLIGVDLVGDGEVTVQLGFREDDATTFNDNAGFSSSANVTTPYTIDSADIVPGNPLPIPIEAPSLTLILTFAGNQAWTWEAANLYFQDNRGRGF